MALTTAYASGLLSLVDGTVDFETDGVYAVLLNGYTFSVAHNAYSDVSTDELTDTDYDPVALTGKSVALVGNDVLYDSDTISFGDPVSIGPADGIALIVGSAASPDAADQLLFYAPLNDVQSTDAVFQITTPEGIYQINHDAS